jgi:UTP--glucose-1-phosphate uridylyltransferase
MLPITKSIEKCMLPVGTRPVVDYVVRDIVAAGITDIYFVVGEQSSQIRSYFSENLKLNEYLRARGKDDLLGLVTPLQGVTFHFITQPPDGNYGTSVPVALAAPYIDDGESALVIMGDQFFYREDGGSNAAELLRLIDERSAGAAMYGVEVPWDSIDSSIEKDENGNFVRIIEKPTAGEAPTNLQNASFYVFDKELFELAKTMPANPTRGEYELTDVLNAYVAKGGHLAVGSVQGEYMECGSVNGWLAANERIIRGQ